jgi:hypothetical protein
MTSSPSRSIRTGTRDDSRFRTVRGREVDRSSSSRSGFRSPSIVRAE